MCLQCYLCISQVIISSAYLIHPVLNQVGTDPTWRAKVSLNKTSYLRVSTHLCDGVKSYQWEVLVVQTKLRRQRNNGLLLAWLRCCCGVVLMVWKCGTTRIAQERRCNRPDLILPVLLPYLVLTTTISGMFTFPRVPLLKLNHVGYMKLAMSEVTRLKYRKCIR